MPFKKGAPKTGGRKKGGLNKETKTRALAVALAGMTPLEYMLGVLRDPDVPKERRDDMAKAAAPYCHARLQATAVIDKEDIPMVFRLPTRITKSAEWEKLRGGHLLENDSKDEH